jgi:IS30 family transposase
METVIDMLEKFKKNALVIHTITCDSGTEFTNELATDWFANENITTFFVVGNSHKLGIVNRFHRTLKDKLAKLFLSTDSYNWIDHIN